VALFRRYAPRALLRESIVRVSFGSCGHVLSISEVNFIVGCITCTMSS